MKWNYQIPHHGNERIIRRFLILPKYINGIAMWLCFARIKQRYEGQNWADDGWKDVCFE